jgi:hypothetical protein
MLPHHHAPLVSMTLYPPELQTQNLIWESKSSHFRIISKSRLKYYIGSRNYTPNLAHLKNCKIQNTIGHEIWDLLVEIRSGIAKRLVLKIIYVEKCHPNTLHRRFLPLIHKGQFDVLPFMKGGTMMEIGAISLNFKL